MEKKFKVFCSIAAVSLMLMACSNEKNTTKKVTNNKNPKQEQKQDPNQEVKGWSTFGYDYTNTRHVPYNLISKANVKDLGIVWSKDFMAIDKDIPGGNQGFPIVVDGVLYTTTSYDHVFAFQAE